MNANEGSFLRNSFLHVVYAVFNSLYLSLLAEVKPVKFSSDSFLVLQFKDSYRREQQRKERESNSARKRRAVSSSNEQFSVRFRSRDADALLFLAIDSTTTIVSGYTVLEVGWIVAIKPHLSTLSELCLLWFSFTVPLQNHRKKFMLVQLFPPFTCFPALATSYIPPPPPVSTGDSFPPRLPLVTCFPAFFLLVSCFPAFSTNYMFFFAFFPPVTCFSRLFSTGYMFSRLFTLVTCFPAFSSSYLFSRACYRLLDFPPILRIPALAVGEVNTFFALSFTQFAKFCWTVTSVLLLTLIFYCLFL